MKTSFNTKKKGEKKPKRKMYSNRIKAILVEVKMSQQELADLAGIKTPHLSRIINGQRQCISLPIAIRIAQALGRPVEDVFQVDKESNERVVRK